MWINKLSQPTGILLLSLALSACGGGSGSSSTPANNPGAQVSTDNSSSTGNTSTGTTDTGTASSGATDVNTGSTDTSTTDASDTGSGASGTGTISSGSGTTGTDSSSSGNTSAGQTEAGSTDTSSSGTTDSSSNGTGSTDSGSSESSNIDSTTTDSGTTDSGSTDTGSTDAGNNSTDSTDTGSSDSTSSTDSASGAVGKPSYSVGKTYDAGLDFDRLGGEHKKSDYRVIGYYMPSLADSLPAKSISATVARQLTHINLAFMHFSSQGECIFDPQDDATQVAQVIEDLQTLKQYNPDLKILFSIGGWSLTNDDSPTVENYRQAFAPANRATMVSSCVAFMEQYGFDGIDIDWEYPRSQDVDNFIAGLADLRSALDGRGKGEELSIAGAGGAFFMSRYFDRLPAVVAQLDFINLMTYDLNGPWNGVTKTNFHAHLYGNNNEPTFYNALREVVFNPIKTWEETTRLFPSPFELTVDAAIKQHLIMNIPRSKIVMGVPFYGRAFFNTAKGNNGLYQSFATPGGDPYVGDVNLLTGCDACAERGEPRVATYREIEELKSGDHGYTYHFDEQTKAPWLYHAQNNIFVTYDDERSMIYKTDYIKSEGLGGVMFWHLGQDDSNFTLLNTLHTELNGANAGLYNGEGPETIVDAPNTDTGADTGNETNSSNGASENNTNNNGLPSMSAAAWSANAIYNTGDTASLNGNVYQAKWWTQGDQPDLNSGTDNVWALVGVTN